MYISHAFYCQFPVLQSLLYASSCEAGCVSTSYRICIEPCAASDQTFKLCQRSSEQTWHLVLAGLRARNYSFKYVTWSMRKCFTLSIVKHLSFQPPPFSASINYVKIPEFWMICCLRGLSTRPLAEYHIFEHTSLSLQSRCCYNSLAI